MASTAADQQGRPACRLEDDPLVQAVTTTVRQACGDVDVELDHRGNQHLVVHVPSAQLCWRFPRTSTRAAGLAESVARHQRAEATGLPVPELLDWRAHSDSEQGYMVVRRVVGFGVDEPVVRGFDRDRQARLGAELGRLLTALAEARSDDPGQPAWSDLWLGWRQSLARALDELIVSERTTPDRARDWLERADRAVDQAATCRTGLVHGDLGGVNLRVDEAGRIVAVLDWDESFFADLGTDAAAVAAGVVPGVWKEVARGWPELERRRRDYTAYLPTWSLQSITWALAQGNDEVLTQALRDSEDP